MPYNAEQQAAYYQLNKEKLNARRQANRVAALKPNRFDSDLVKHLSKIVNREITLDQVETFVVVDITTIKRLFEVQFADGMSWDNYKKVWSISNRYRVSEFDHPDVAMSFMTNPKAFYPAKAKVKFVESDVDLLWSSSMKAAVPWLSEMPKSSSQARMVEDDQARLLRKLEGEEKYAPMKLLKEQGLTMSEAVKFVTTKKKELGCTPDEVKQLILTKQLVPSK